MSYFEQDVRLMNEVWFLALAVGPQTAERLLIPHDKEVT
jgi:hypothetical protein